MHYFFLKLLKFKHIFIENFNLKMCEKDRDNNNNSINFHQLLFK